MLGHTLTTAFPFRPEQVIGRGAHTVVHRAVHLPSDTLVALKVLTDPSNGNLARLFEEGVLMKAVSHPNVRRAVANGFTGDGAAFLAMTYVPGCTLADRIRQGRMLQADEAIPLFEQLAAGLAAVHRADIVHRDIKPANVLLLRGACDMGHVLLSDFGVAARMGQIPREIVVGTAGFIAPEILAGDHSGSPAADVFALGVLMYRAIHGEMPAVSEPPDPAGERSDPDPAREGLVSLVAQCCQADPRGRPTAEALLSRLMRLHRRTLDASLDGEFQADAGLMSTSPSAVGVLLGFVALLVGGVALVGVLIGTVLMSQVLAFLAS